MTNPQDEMARIERMKGGLLNDVFRWILDTPQYTAVTDMNSDSSDSSSRLLWIKGHAGMGKTMQMIGIIRELSDQVLNTAPSVAYYFCQGTDEAAQNSGTAILRALIWMLLAQQPQLMKHLRSEHERTQQDEIFTGNRNARDVVLRIFKRMLKDAGPTYLIVDALDECNEDLELLLDLISATLNESASIKWIVSSRPEIDVVNLIKDKAAKMTDDAIQVIGLDKQDLQVSVDAYISYRLSSLEGRAGYTKTILTDIATEIRRRSEKTFLWVSLVFRVLDKKDHRLRPLHGSYALKAVKEMPSGLPKLYGHMMIRIERGSADDPQYCKKILAIIAVVKRPLSLLELAAVTGFTANEGPEPQYVIDNCGSFLTVENQVVSLIHQSAKDYLLDEMKALDTNRAHRLDTIIEVNIGITNRSMDVMSKVLLSQLSVGFPEQPIPAEDVMNLEYVFSSWLDHLREAYQNAPDAAPGAVQDVVRLCDSALIFMQSQFLAWLECLIVLKNLSKAITSMETLAQAIQVGYSLPCREATNDVWQASDEVLQLAAFMRDAKEFAFINKSIIEEAPVQIYGSALTFSPLGNQVREAFWQRRVPYLKGVTCSDRHKAAATRLLRYDCKEDAPAFSNDGTLFALGVGATLQLWDVTSGTMRSTFTGYAGWLFRITFSLDDKWIAAAHRDTIELRAIGDEDNDLTRHVSAQRVQCTSDVVLAALSADGSMLAAVCNVPENVIELWNLKFRTRQLIESGDGPVKSMAISRKGMLATLAVDCEGGELTCAVVLRRDITGDHERTFRYKGRDPRSVVFSSSGKSLALTGHPYAVYMLQDESQEFSKMIDLEVDQPMDKLQDIAFSSDDSTVAALTRRSVRIWKLENEACHMVSETEMDIPFQYHHIMMTLIGDALSMIIASTDYLNVRLEKVTPGSKLESPNGHTEQINSIAFSPNGSALATASDDATFRVWNLDLDLMGQEPSAFQSPDGNKLYKLAFSDDGSRLAVASDDLIWIYPIISSQPAGYIADFEAPNPRAVVFSPDMRWLFSAYGRTICVWDLVNSRLKWEMPNILMEWHNHYHFSCSFSANSERIALTADEASALYILSSDSGTVVQKVPVGYHSAIGDLCSFADDLSHLITTRGTLALNTNSGERARFTPSKLADRKLRVEGDWIKRGPKCLLWLPPEFRSSGWAQHDSTIALGHMSGPLTIIEFVPDQEHRVKTSSAGVRRATWDNDSLPAESESEWSLNSASEYSVESDNDGNTGFGDEPHSETHNEHNPELDDESNSESEDQRSVEAYDRRSNRPDNGGTAAE